MSQDKITKNVERELLNHCTLIHPHIVRFRECFLTAKYLAIAMDYAAGGDMYKYVLSRCWPRGLGNAKGVVAGVTVFSQGVILQACHALTMHATASDLSPAVSPHIVYVSGQRVATEVKGPGCDAVQGWPG